jgi:hypothetical protein
MMQSVPMISLEGFPLSLQQQHLWLLQQGSSRPFCARSAVLIKGNVDAAALRDGLQTIIARHEIFRTTLQSAPGTELPVQVIADSASLFYRELSLCDLTSEEQETRIEKLFDEERETVFDLQHGPLLKATLINLSLDKNVLLLTLPTHCADARTVRNIVSELAGAMRGEEFSSQPIQYADFGAWQNALLDQDGSEIAAPEAIAMIAAWLQTVQEGL